MPSTPVPAPRRAGPRLAWLVAWLLLLAPPHAVVRAQAFGPVRAPQGDADPTRGAPASGTAVGSALDALIPRETLRAASPTRASSGAPRVAAVRIAPAVRRLAAAPAARRRARAPAPASARAAGPAAVLARTPAPVPAARSPAPAIALAPTFADARPPRAGILDPLGAHPRRESAEHDRARELAPSSSGRLAWDPDALLAALAGERRADADGATTADAGESPERALARLLPRDVVRCLEPGLHRRRAEATPRFLLAGDDDVASPTSWRVRDEVTAPGSKVLRGVYQARLLDIRIAGQDIALQWSAGSSSEGVRPLSGSPVSTDTTGGTEIIELRFGDPSGGSLSTYVRGRRQPEDAYASAFGRGIEGTAGLQYSPGGRWDWRLQAQQQFVNHVTDPIQAMEFSLWARLRF